MNQNVIRQKLLFLIHSFDFFPKKSTNDDHFHWNIINHIILHHHENITSKSIVLTIANHLIPVEYYFIIFN
jgi:hypothetical protein